MMGLGLGMGLWGFIWMLLFWAGLILLAVWLVGYLFPPAKADKDRSASAQDILKMRYAQGELTEEQYQHMIEMIEQ